MMNDTKIIELLKDTGHLDYPFGEKQDIPPDFASSKTRTIEDPIVEKGIDSYQDLLIEHLDPLCLKHHSRPARLGTGMGPATQELFELPRCGCCDYGEAVLPAVGKGSWPRCHNIGEFHAATVRVDKRGIPSFLEPVFEQVWDRVVASYEALGLRWIRTEDDDANIDFTFVSRSRGWIGLAIVGQGETCGSHIWCRYLSTYKPRDVVGEWATLIMHELGHNASLQHTRGGIMSPSIINGLTATWKGDPSESILKRQYGGEPIEPKPPGPPDGKYGIIHWQDGTFSDVMPRARVPA